MCTNAQLALQPDAQLGWELLKRSTFQTERFHRSPENISSPNDGTTALSECHSRRVQELLLDKDYTSSKAARSVARLADVSALKYLALIFTPEDYVDLDRYVFTTEAHPLLQVRHQSSKDCTQMESVTLRQPSSPILSMLGNSLLCLLVVTTIVPRISGRHKSKIHELKKKI